MLQIVADILTELIIDLSLTVNITERECLFGPQDRVRESVNYMIDPITAVATATAAFNTIKQGFQAGRDIEGMAGDLGRWMGAVSDIKKAEDYSKKPPLFKKLFAAGSVEEEAMQAFMAKKKAEDMREELRNIISFTRGPSAWDELLKTEADIRKKRQAAIYAQQEYRQKVIEWVAIGVATIVMLGMIGFFVWLIAYDRGMV